MGRRIHQHRVKPVVFERGHWCRLDFMWSHQRYQILFEYRLNSVAWIVIVATTLSLTSQFENFLIYFVNVAQIVGVAGD